MFSSHLGLLAAALLQGEEVIPSWTLWGTCASEPAFAGRQIPFTFPQELEVAKFAISHMREWDILRGHSKG